MPKRISIILLFTAVFATAALFLDAPSVAEDDPCENQTCRNDYPYAISNFDGFLGNEEGGCGFFNLEGETACKPSSAFSLSSPTGTWEVTAIANEAGHNLRILLVSGETQVVLFEKPAYGSGDQCQQFGVWKRVNFDAGESLKFVDLSSSPNKESVIPYSGGGGCDAKPAFLMCELNNDTNGLGHLGVPQDLAEGTVLIGWNDGAEDCDHDDIIVALRRVSSPRAVVPISSACVEFGEISVGKLYLKIPRVDGSCDVDLDRIGFYLNDENCESAYICPQNSAAGCQYPAPLGDCEDEDVEGPCIDFGDLSNKICAQPGSPCNECLNYRIGSPTCTSYRTPTGAQVKCCVLDDGSACSWKKCCKNQQQIQECGYQQP